MKLQHELYEQETAHLRSHKRNQTVSRDGFNGNGFNGNVLGCQKPSHYIRLLCSNYIIKIQRAISVQWFSSYS